jgi:hypothetical protein
MDIVNDWEDFELPSVTENDYGYDFPPGTPQLAIELQGFRRAKNNDPEEAKFDTAFNHALRIIQLLWDDEHVCIQRNGALNTYFLDILSDLCEFRDMGVAGPASSAKTYTCAIFMLVCFYAMPDKFAGLISTTSGTSAERRVWADVKALHRAARFQENKFPAIGEILEYLKCIVYNAGLILDKKFNVRDFRNGILVVPVGNDSSGEQAMATIQGTKNVHVTWMIDEGPLMPGEIMQPRGNLIHNLYHQFIIVGNSDKKTDPHGRAMEPLLGWGTVDRTHKRWRAKTLNSLFLDGEKGPNDIYGDSVTELTKYPFPYLSNKIKREAQALIEGDGNVEAGRNTIGYWKFAIGYWLGSDIQQTVLSEQFVKSHNADREPDRWGIGKVRVFAALDPAFTAGGDVNALTFATVGRTVNGKMQCLFESTSIEIKPVLSDRKEYSRALAEKVVEICEDRGVFPQDFGIDISNDGGITAKNVLEVWTQGGIQALSSMEPSTSSRYGNRVSQYWMEIRKLLQTGACCGFNCNSNYAKDLFERRFRDESKVFHVEKKKDLKKRIRRSPDCGDSFSYLCRLITQSGMLSVTEVPTNEDGDRMAEWAQKYFNRGGYNTVESEQELGDVLVVDE